MTSINPLIPFRY